MPQVNISSGVIILGTRNELPPGAGTQTQPVSPLQVNVKGGTVIAINGLSSTILFNNSSLPSSGAATLITSNFQSIVMDAVFGPMTGSVQLAIMGVEPVSGFQTSTVLSTPWLFATVQSGIRIVSSAAQKPLGKEIAVTWTATGAIPNVYITAQLVS